MGARSISVCGETISGSAHICAFFNSRAEAYDVLVPFYRDGLAKGDRMVGIVEGFRRDAHLRGLRAGGVPVDRAMRERQLDVLTADETYLRNGTFDADAMLAAVRDMLTSAKAEQRSVRTCGEMDWLARSSVPSSVVIEYEARVNDFTYEHDCTLMCVYDLAQITGALMADIISTHPYVVMNRKLRHNPHFIEPKTYLDEVLRPRAVPRPA